MNFLAHLYLSGDDEFVKIGNFMADGIKGKSYTDYPLKVQEGILLHRKIDTFTDFHPIFKQSTQRLHKQYHHYSPVIVDMFYDHFLAKNWERYSEHTLEDFTTNFYKSLQANPDILSDRIKNMLPYLLKYNLLLDYKHISGIDTALKQMDRASKDRSKMSTASIVLTEYYSEFEQEFFSFFQEIRTYLDIN